MLELICFKVLSQTRWGAAGIVGLCLNRSIGMGRIMKHKDKGKSKLTER